MIYALDFHYCSHHLNCCGNLGFGNMTIIKSGYARRDLELYETEPWVTRALMKHVDLEGLHVWEPGAGNHMMADVLKEKAASVLTTDIKTYSRKHDDLIDFESMVLTKKPTSLAIITNPPYGGGGHQAGRWCRIALALTNGIVAMLLRANFDSGSTRVDLFRDNRRFRFKIVLLDRISWTHDGVTGSEDHAWFVWGAKKPLPGAGIRYEGRPR